MPLSRACLSLHLPAPRALVALVRWAAVVDDDCKDLTADVVTSLAPRVRGLHVCVGCTTEKKGLLTTMSGTVWRSGAVERLSRGFTSLTHHVDAIILQDLGTLKRTASLFFLSFSFFSFCLPLLFHFFLFFF